MKIGPVDIRNHTFRKKLQGVDPAEVEAYLELVADRLEESVEETHALEEKIADMQRELAEYKKQEVSA